MRDCFLIFLRDNCNDSQLTFKDSTSYQNIESKLSAAFADYSIVYSLPVNYSGKLSSLTNIVIRSDNETDSWRDLLTNFDADNFIRIYADAPFCDMTIVTEMLNVHTTYVAEYTYSENIPIGFCCDIISKELINSLPEADQSKAMLPIEKVVKDNINQFDVELFYKEPDIRQLRLSFLNGNPREKIVMENIVTLDNSLPNYANIQTIIKTNPELLYISPSYLELELSPEINNQTIYSPIDLATSEREEMSVDLFTSILNGMQQFQLPYTLSLAGPGEPLKNSNFYKIFETALSDSLIENLIVESDGILLDNNFIQYIEDKDITKLKVIVKCNGYDSNSYTLIHNNDSFAAIEQNILALNNIIKKNLFVELMKINETEPYLDRYYDYWEERDIQIILQKQNTYLGALKDRRYYDLTPLKRIPCWHLQRDLFILSNGDVPFCKQDLAAKFSLLSLKNMPISEIWQERRLKYLENYHDTLATSPDCKKCDEWFTFNM